MAPERYPKRQVGRIYLMLSMGTAIVVLVLARRFNLSLAQTATTLISALPPAYLSWNAYRDDRRDASRKKTINDIANELADAVETQWEAEASLHRLNDPHPLPVSWEAADATLFESWEHLVTTVRSWPMEPPGSPTVPITHPVDLRGSNAELGNTLALVPTGRLVVLGEPGAGKSMLLLRLVLDLIARRQPNQPVPVMVSLASWNPGTQTFHAWLIDRLSIDYQGLANPAPGMRNVWNVQALLDRHLLLPVLDGLDEIPKELRSLAIARINESLRPRDRLVLSCRIGEFREAVRPDAGPVAMLRGAMGVVLRPLDSVDIEVYLRRDAGGPPGDRQWEPILALLGTDTPVGHAFQTPLMVSLARVVYAPRQVEPGGVCNDPSELCDSASFSTREDIQNKLFDGFIPAAYRPHPDLSRRCPWTSANAETWLISLAHHLERDCAGTSDLAWWNVERSAPRSLVGLTAAGMAGLAAVPLGALGAAGRTGAFAIALTAALTVGLTVRRISGARGSLIAGLAIGAISGLLGGWIGGSLGSPVGGLAGGSANGVAVGFLVGANSGLLGGALGGFAGGIASGALGSLSTGVPGAALDGLMLAVALGITVSLMRRRAPAWGPSWSPIGVVVGLFAGISVGLVILLASGPMYTLLLIVPLGLLAGFTGGLGGVPTNLAAALHPCAVLHRDRTMSLLSAAGFGICAGIAAGLVTGVSGGPRPGVISGVGLGLGTAIGAGLGQGSWGAFAITRCWLALNRRTPWRLMRFLDDAHEQRGVLRRVGTIYQFRHVEFQRRLARRFPVDSGSQAAPTPTSPERPVDLAHDESETPRSDAPMDVAAECLGASGQDGGARVANRGKGWEKAHHILRNLNHLFGDRLPKTVPGIEPTDHNERPGSEPAETDDDESTFGMPVVEDS